MAKSFLSTIYKKMNIELIRIESCLWWNCSILKKVTKWKPLNIMEIGFLIFITKWNRKRYKNYLEICKNTLCCTIIEESFNVVVKIVLWFACKMHPFDVANVNLSNSNSNQQFSSNCIHYGICIKFSIKITIHISNFEKWLTEYGSSATQYRLQAHSTTIQLKECKVKSNEMLSNCDYVPFVERKFERKYLKCLRYALCLAW